jgi:hypothetical protein
VNESTAGGTVALLDDYQRVALKAADWTRVQPRKRVDVFHDHRADGDAVALRLTPYDVVCVMRERTPLRRDITERLPRLELICSTGARNASIDAAAAAERGLEIVPTGAIPRHREQHSQVAGPPRLVSLRDRPMPPVRHMRNPPVNANSLLPRHAPSGNVFKRRALPPPNTT